MPAQVARAPRAAQDVTVDGLPAPPVRSSRTTDAGVLVYRSVDDLGNFTYIGVTNNLTRRQREHLAARGLQIRPFEGLQDLSRADARAVEQVLIEVARGRSDPLLNRINSVALSNPGYGDAIARGSELLSQAGLGDLLRYR